MRSKPLWQVSVVTSPEAEEAVVELMGRVFNLPAAVYTNEETKVTIASVYCEGRGELTNKTQAALIAGLKRIKAGGLRLGAGKISTGRVAREDWAESWK